MRLSLGLAHEVRTQSRVALPAYCELMSPARGQCPLGPMHVPLGATKEPKTEKDTWTEPIPAGVAPAGVWGCGGCRGCGRCSGPLPAPPRPGLAAPRTHGRRSPRAGAPPCRRSQPRARPCASPPAAQPRSRAGGEGRGRGVGAGTIQVQAAAASLDPPPPSPPPPPASALGVDVSSALRPLPAPRSPSPTPIPDPAARPSFGSPDLAHHPSRGGEGPLWLPGPPGRVSLLPSPWSCPSLHAQRCVQGLQQAPSLGTWAGS